MAIRQIRILGDEILRKKSRIVEEIDEKIIKLLDDMHETISKSDDGIGIAAPQVGVLKRLVVIDLSKEGGPGPFKLINPVVVKTIGEQTCREGCLSVPGKVGDVKRPREVVVEATNEKGEKISIRGKDLLAVVLSHEIDHLDGILFIDKASEVFDSTDDDEEETSR
jgi:peptide deformylase